MCSNRKFRTTTSKQFFPIVLISSEHIRMTCKHVTEKENGKMLSLSSDNTGRYSSCAKAGCAISSNC